MLTHCQPCKTAALAVVPAPRTPPRTLTAILRGCCSHPDLRRLQSPGPARPPHAVSRSHRSVAGTPSTPPRAQHRERRRGAELASPAVPGPSLRGVGARQLPPGLLPFCAQSQSGETSVFHKPRAEANPGLDARAHATADPHTKSRGQTRKLVPSSRTTRMTKAANSRDAPIRGRLGFQVYCGKLILPPPSAHPTKARSVPAGEVTSTAPG